MARESYVGRHRRGRHRRPVDHVIDGWPCLKTRTALAVIAVGLSAAFVAAFGDPHLVPVDPPALVTAAYVAPVAVTGCVR